MIFKCGFCIDEVTYRGKKVRAKIWARKIPNYKPLASIFKGDGEWILRYHGGRIERFDREYEAKQVAMKIMDREVPETTEALSA